MQTEQVLHKLSRTELIPELPPEKRQFIEKYCTTDSDAKDHSDSFKESLAKAIASKPDQHMVKSFLRMIESSISTETIKSLRFPHNFWYGNKSVCSIVRCPHHFPNGPCNGTMGIKK